MTEQEARDKIIVALDVPTLAEAVELVKTLGDSVSFYKIGLELLYAGGIELARKLISEGKDIFIDAKLHDIPNTVERATRQLSALGAKFLTVHAYPETMRAAIAGRGDSKLKIIGVTVLTSMSQQDLHEAGYDQSIASIVEKRVQAAKQLNIDGIVCSPQEAQAARKTLGANAIIVTPGIRPLGADSGDQQRTATPESAIASGASHLVVGRPITQAKNPRLAAELILQSIMKGMKAA